MNSQEPLGTRISRIEDPGLSEECMDALFEKDRLSHLGGFVQGLIHNMNGPLQNMSMLVEVLIRGQDQIVARRQEGPSARTEQDALHEKQGKRLWQLGAQITALAEMLRGFMVLHEVERNESEVDINLVLTKLAETFRADLFYKHQISVDLRLTKNLPLVRILGRHLIPALVHIIKNAIIAMRDSSEKQLTIESLSENGKIRVLLTDTGAGLEPGQDSERCFDLFFSNWPASDLSRVEERHLGFGLFAVKRLLEPYGVMVRLDCAGKGTSVVLDIPFPVRES